MECSSFLMGMKVTPALAAGNTVVLKSAEEAPLTVLYVAELLKDIFPAGVLNVISGEGPSCGAPLVKHPQVRKVSFTGSVETGRIIYKLAAEKLIPVTLELGGKNPMIVFEDADLEKAIEGALTAMRFTRQGQSCTAASRIYVQGNIYETFISRLKKSVDQLIIGDPFEETTDIGAIISAAQYEKVCGFLSEAQALKGARVIKGSRLPTSDALKKGLFLQPTLLVDLSTDARAVREEIFGPVTCIIPFKDYEQAIALANDSSYGLAAAIWTQNIKRALDGAQRLEAGFVQVNQYGVAQASTPFGGYKNSGLGKEASLGAMLEHYTKEKTILINLD